MPAERDLEQTRHRPPGLLSDPASRPRIQTLFVDPPPDLADIVERIWAGWWDLPPTEPHESVLLGDPSVHLVFEAQDGGLLPDAQGARVVGVWTETWRRTLAGTGCVRGIKLRPGAVPALLSQSAHTYTNRQTPIGLRTLGQRVVRASPQEAAEHLLDWVRTARRPAPHVPEAVSIAQTLMHGDVLRVEDVAEASGRSVRGLQRLFRSHVGASPKWMIRRRRLQQVAQQLDRGERPVLADLAYTLGYADQAHLARDVRAATGRTLTQLMADLARVGG